MSTQNTVLLKSAQAQAGTHSGSEGDSERIHLQGEQYLPDMRVQQAPTGQHGQRGATGEGRVGSLAGDWLSGLWDIQPSEVHSYCVKPDTGGS